MFIFIIFIYVYVCVCVERYVCMDAHRGQKDFQYLAAGVAGSCKLPSVDVED